MAGTSRSSARNDRALMAASVTGVEAATVALRGAGSSTASSPKYAPGWSVDTFLLRQREGLEQQAANVHGAIAAAGEEQLGELAEAVDPLQIEGDLEQRRPTRIVPRRQLLHEERQGVVLMLQPTKDRFPRPPKKRSECRVAREIGAYRGGVDAITNDIREFWPTAAGGW